MRWVFLRQALMIWLWGVVVMAWSTWLCVTPSPLLVFQLPDVRMHLTHAQIFQVRQYPFLRSTEPPTAVCE